MLLPELASQLNLTEQLQPGAVADVLREAILRGVYRSGQPLRQEDLAAGLGVSRMPVRDALKQLETEGFVVSMPHRGAVVAHVSAAEAQELHELRLALEPLLLRLAVPQLSRADLGRAEDLLDEADRETDQSRWSELNWEFHMTLYRAANRPRISGMVRGLHLTANRYMRMALTTMHHQQTSQAEHRAILEACRERNAALACDLLTGHITNSGQNLIAYLISEGHTL